jgi:hypothetical protein
MRRIAVLMVPAALAGCGSGDEPDPLPADPPRAEQRPRLRAPELVKIERVGQQMGTHDTVTVGEDGSATVVNAHGGGGFVTRRCTLTPDAVAGVRRAVAGLPIDGPRRRRRAPRPKGYYVPHPYFVVTRGGRADTFSAERMPADGVPFARHLVRLMAGRDGRCRRAFQQRVS